MKSTIRHNSYKNGFEIKFSSKPDPKTIDLLKSSGFKYNGDGQYWWSVISSDSIDTVNTIGNNPVCSSCLDSVEVLKRLNSLLGKTVDEPILNPLHADISAIIKSGKSEFLDELKQADSLLWKMVESTREHGPIVPQLGPKYSGLKATIKSLSKSKTISVGDNQYALFGVSSNTRKKGKGKKR